MFAREIAEQLVRAPQKVEVLAEKVYTAVTAHERKELLQALGCTDPETGKWLQHEWAHWADSEHCFSRLSQQASDAVFYELTTYSLSEAKEAARAWLTYCHLPSKPCIARIESKGTADDFVRLWRRYKP